MQIPAYFYLWAKTNRDTGQIHPLIYHLMDVGEVVLGLWTTSLVPAVRLQFSRILGIGDEETAHLLAFWASLHDIGKAAPQFQRKYEPVVPLLMENGFGFPSPSPHPAPHGVLTAWALENLLQEETGLPVRAARLIARALGGHHGTWPIPSQMQIPNLQSSDKGDDAWHEARKGLARAVMEIFQPPANFQFPTAQNEVNTLLVLFSGLVSVADWIGSSTDFFQFESAFLPPDEYARRSARQAEEALRYLGWVGWEPDGMKPDFEQLFHFSAHASQEAAFQNAENLPQPTLLIIEAPTGSGKTETALYLADRWLQASQGRGIYIAMPTQATSNQMFGRVEQFLTGRYPDQIINLHLVHGAALLMDCNQVPEWMEVFDEEGAPQSGGVRAQTWFLPRKRTLLAPFGVGTVDQALMSVLQTRHFFVRLFGLGQKVVVFDEVHAYDTYMSVLFRRLLAWLRSIGTSVILLSATLPETVRSELVAAWLGGKAGRLPPCKYPRLTLAAGDRLESIPLPEPPPRHLRLEWIHTEPEALAAQLSEKLIEGGCAAVICNRVARAQQIYQALKQAAIVPQDGLILFHARYPYEWRKEIEDRVLGLFSKNGRRPEKAIVVATQVIEQSLDLDFDYMISDLAPVDLLLQRAGRLHRHAEANVDKRPRRLAEPTLAVTLPAIRDGAPDFGPDERVYERAMLLRSWLMLQERAALNLPQDTAELIEGVYDSAPEPVDAATAAAVHAADEKARRERESAVSQAKSRLVPRPDDEELLNSRNENLEEDDPNVHEAFQALTRLSEPGVSLVCLHRTAKGLALDPNGAGAPLDLNSKPDVDLMRAYLKRTVTVQRKEVVQYFQEKRVQLIPQAWKETAALRYDFPVIFDEEGRYPLEGAPLTLFLSRETGLEIRKETI